MALHFNSDSGTDDYLSKSVAIFSGHTYPLAFSAWVRPDDRGAQYAVASDSGSGTGKQIRLGASSGGKFLIGMRGTNVGSSVHYDNSNTTWFHITGLFIASNNIKLYVNGSLDGENTTATNNISDFADSDEFYIGTGIQSGTNLTGRSWEGGIAEVAAYTAQLSAGEITALAAGFSPLLVRPDALVGYWPLGGAYPNGNMDLVGGNSLTTNGGPSAEAHPPKIFYPSAPWSFGVVEEEEEEEEVIRRWSMESIELHIAEAGGRRHSAEDNPTAATNKGWYLESLEVQVSRAGQRRK